MSIRICIITGTRAEYGLFYPLMKEIQKNDAFQLQIIATGMHLSPEFGMTYQVIEQDGFVIDEKVETLLSSDTDAGIAKSTGLSIISLTDALKRLQPDWVVLLGDRFETFAAATTAYLLKIPVIHLHGGELTEGATDEGLRHAITKMSYLHFTSAEEYRKRVIQLGESPDRVFNVGALSIDNIKHMPLLSKGELSVLLNVSLDVPTFLITYHPVTLEQNTSMEHFNHLLRALDEFPEHQKIFTLPNADANGRVIIRMIEEYVKNQDNKAFSFTSLGQLKYLSLLQYSDVVIGNSSSGITEVPSFHIPTVNIGDRQRGRIRAASIIDCGTSKEDITNAISKALSATFKSECKQHQNPYGDGDTAVKIVKTLTDFPQVVLKKKFYNL